MNAVVASPNKIAPRCQRSWKYRAVAKPELFMSRTLSNKHLFYLFTLNALVSSCSDEPAADNLTLNSDSSVTPSATAVQPGTPLTSPPLSPNGNSSNVPTPSASVPSNLPSGVPSNPSSAATNTAPSSTSTLPSTPSATGSDSPVIGSSGSGGAMTSDGGNGGGGSAPVSAGGASNGGNGSEPQNSAGSNAAGENSGAAGASGTAGGGLGGAGSTPGSGLGSGVMTGSGTSDARYETGLVSRNDVPYVLITNGWGPGFDDHVVSWEGTSFIVESMLGSAGPMGQPASYPTVFCGRYSVMQVPDCGLPAPKDSITTLRTGWRWAPNGNAGEYNAAYDIWVGNGNNLQGYLMVWLRDPPSYQPAGAPNMDHQGITVANVPGTWDIWDGSVNGLPIINWVRAEGSDSQEIEFDVMDLLRDAEARGLNVPGTHINAVAVGFEIWEGPITNLESVDFYVEVQ